VAGGDTLSSISLEYYHQANMTLIDHILEFNPQMGDMNLIKTNQRIKIPEINAEAFVKESGGGKYVVHLGTFDYPEAIRLYNHESILSGKDIEAVPRKVSPKETWYRVVAGKFESKEEALKTFEVLRGKKLIPVPY
jgi:phage tail protein X